MSKECNRCGSESLADYNCSECGNPEVIDSDESHFLDEDDHLFSTDPDGGESQIICSKCGHESFTVEYDDYCSWCRHQVDKGN
jgi:ribosomal protein L37E